MYKAPLTATVFKDFSSCYQHFVSQNSPSLSNQPFVYVDASGVKLVTNVVSENEAPDGVFALSMSEDGWVEMLAINVAS